MEQQNGAEEWSRMEQNGAELIRSEQNVAETRRDTIRQYFKQKQNTHTTNHKTTNP